MKKCYFILLIFILNFSMSAQVGINTNTPSATLHVQKRASLSLPDGIIPPRISGDSLRLKESVYAAGQNGAIVYVTSAATTTGPKTVGVTSTGLFVYDANATNSSGNGLWFKLPTTASPTTGTGDGAYAARVSGNLSILNLSLTLLGSTARFIRLPIANNSPSALLDIPSSQVTNIPTGDSYYTIPSTGIYQINYSYRTGQGIKLQLLASNRPGVLITKTPVGTTTKEVLDYRYYGGVSLLDLLGISVADIALTQGTINHIYQLNSGDRLHFGIVDGGLGVNLLTDASAEISIYKVK